MTTYTNLEVITYNAILDICGEDIGANIGDIVNATNQTSSVLRGVLSSLLKKKMIMQDEENGMILFAPCDGTSIYCWGGESLTEEEFKAFVPLKAE